jgi:hypothetical protein
MQKIICCIGSVLIFFLSGKAQKTAIGVNLGYSFSAASQNLLTQIENSGNRYNTNGVFTSMGEGLTANLQLTRWFNKSSGVFVTASYRNTLTPVKGSQKLNGIDDFYQADTKWNSSVIIISPGVSFKIPYNRLAPFARAGVLLPVYSEVKETATYSSGGFGGNRSGIKKITYRLNTTLGYTMALGIAPDINKRLSFFSELAIEALSIKVKKSNWISDIQNGVEKINDYSISTKEIIYKKRLDENFPYDPNKPSQALSFSLPYSTIGIRAGINIKL